MAIGGAEARAVKTWSGVPPGTSAVASSVRKIAEGQARDTYCFMAVRMKEDVAQEQPTPGSFQCRIESRRGQHQGGGHCSLLPHSHAPR